RAERGLVRAVALDVLVAHGAHGDHPQRAREQDVAGSPDPRLAAGADRDLVLLEAGGRAHADLEDPVRVLHDLNEGLRRGEDPAVVAVGIDLDWRGGKADRVDRLADDLPLALARHDAGLFPPPGYP